MGEGDSVTENALNTEEIKQQRNAANIARLNVVLAMIFFPAAYLFHFKFLQDSYFVYVVLAGLCIMVGVYAALMAIINTMEVHFLRFESRDRRRGWSENEGG